MYCDFGASEEFIQLCRDHLTQLIATQWDGARWKPVPDLEPSTAAVEQLVEAEPLAALEADEPGLLDLRVRQDEAFASSMAAVGQIAELMSHWAESDRQWTAQLHARSGRPVSPKEAQTVVNLKAADFGQRSNELRSLRATFKASSDEFFEALTHLVEFQIANGLSSADEMKAGLQHIVAIDSVVRAARDTYVSVAGSLASLPEPTREFRAQKRRLMQQIDNLSAAIGSWLDRSDELRSRFDLGAG